MKKNKVFSLFFALILAGGILPINTMTAFAQETTDELSIEERELPEETTESDEVIVETEPEDQPSDEMETVPETEEEVNDPSSSTEQDQNTDTSITQPQNPVISNDPSPQPEQPSNGGVSSTVPDIFVPYVSSTWYHPVDLEALGKIGETPDALKYDHYLTKNYTGFLYSNNPFEIGQCTWFAWSRFYQVYGYDSGARGNGKTNAAEIVKAHPDQFALSSTPSAGSVFSMEKNTLFPEYGHVGFVEAFDGENLWISEGNYYQGSEGGFIYIHKVKWEEFKEQYPDAVFAVPKEETVPQNIELKQSCQEFTNKVVDQIFGIIGVHK